MEMRTIEIDFDVHKIIETERKNFDESPNEVLRRLLGLSVAPSSGKTNGRTWMSKGVLLPHRTKLRMEYNGILHTAQIEDGHWIIDGQKYNGPSPAAAAVARTRGGSTPNLNGWRYWSAQLPGSSSWIPIDEMRTREGRA